MTFCWITSFAFLEVSQINVWHISYILFRVTCKLILKHYNKAMWLRRWMLPFLYSTTLPSITGFAFFIYTYMCIFSSYIYMCWTLISGVALNNKLRTPIITKGRQKLKTRGIWLTGYCSISMNKVENMFPCGSHFTLKCSSLSMPSHCVRPSNGSPSQALFQYKLNWWVIF